jgi:orotate phosphoribosyltransferase
MIELHNALTVVRRKIAAEGGDIQEGVERSLSEGTDMEVIAKAVIAMATANNVAYRAVGGRGFYSRALATIVPMVHPEDICWFSVRDKPKGHGLRRLTEGARPDSSWDVLIVDTMANPDALDATCTDVTDHTGANISGIIPIVDGEGVAARLAASHPNAVYAPLFTLAELTQAPS